MQDDINYLDIVALGRIKEDTVVERFGGLINSSFLDASEILGSLKLKGLVDFTTAFPGQSAVVVTPLGKQLLIEAAEKAKSELDPLDTAILMQLSNGKRSLSDLSGAVNVRPRDLGMHLFRLDQQQFVAYEMRNGSIFISLTEKGFIKAKTPQAGSHPGPAAQMPAPAAVPAHAQRPAAPGIAAVQQPQAQGADPTDQQIKDVEKKIHAARARRLYVLIASFIVLLVIIGYLVSRVYYVK